MKIVAFLQNMWVATPAKAAVVERHPPTSEVRERMIRYALFAGCLTGRRLKAALGVYLCDRIIWQEASPKVDSNAKQYHAPNPDHIRAVLSKHQPEIVLCLTKKGEPAIRPLIGQIIFHSCPHPACRQVERTMRELMEIREKIMAELHETPRDYRNKRHRRPTRRSVSQDERTVERMKHEVHVLPIDDQQEHVANSECFCIPSLHLNDKDGAPFQFPVFEHHALKGDQQVKWMAREISENKC